MDLTLKLVLDEFSAFRSGERLNNKLDEVSKDRIRPDILQRCMARPRPRHIILRQPIGIPTRRLDATAALDRFYNHSAKRPTHCATSRSIRQQIQWKNGDGNATKV